MFKNLLGYHEVKLLIGNVSTDIEFRVRPDGVRLECEMPPPVASGNFKSIKILGFQCLNQGFGLLIHDDSCPLVSGTCSLQNDG